MTYRPVADFGFPMPPPKPSQATEEIQNQEFGRLFGQMAAARVIALPFFAVLFAAVLWLERPSWRTPVLVLMGVGLAWFFLWEQQVYRRKGLEARAILRNLVGAVFALAGVAFATGGLASPVIYPIVIIAFVIGLLLPPRFTLGLAAFLVATFSTLAYLGASGVIPDLNLSIFGGGPRVSKDPLYLYVHATFLSLAVVLGGQIARIVRRAFEAVLHRTVAAQQELLDAHAERVRELTALSAEIAHELKNPLASVKGLSALLAQSVTEGKQAERLGVLRQEVARMQSILEEFLNFSRPLVPLAVVETNAATVCREVAMLHEGLARERSISLKVSLDDLSLQCDPRKLKQILINLVQNALDASPAGRTVTIEAREIAAKPATGASSGDASTNDASSGDASSGDASTSKAHSAVTIRVIDAGAGVDPSLGDVFEPGTTSKPAGSGLGLTIARALARQHGGDLALLPREGGGTIAEIRLPREPGLPGHGSEGDRSKAP